MLTRKQHELLMFIHERLKEAGIPPSYEEMKGALDLKSKSGIHRLIMSLEERGFIRRLPNRARALEVVRLPESAAPGLASSGRRGGFSPNVIQGSLGRVKPVESGGAASEDGTGIAIPVMGRIAAGVPISAIQDHSHNKRRRSQACVCSCKSRQEAALSAGLEHYGERKISLIDSSW